MNKSDLTVINLYKDNMKYKYVRLFDSINYYIHINDLWCLIDMLIHSIHSKWINIDKIKYI